MPKPADQAQLNASNADLWARLTDSLSHYDGEAAADSFMEAEGLIDTYLEAVAAQSTNLPDRQALALACAHLLVTMRTMTEDDLATLVRLNATSLGVSLYALAPTVAEMKQRALAGLQVMAQPHAGPARTPSVDFDSPF
ncbi:hypothetical protein CEG14_22220 [Bordetella genomosp. 1]|uniref:Uncharacterized protein n=1 Tax=Bordetella genomosp. 1 TaxID=1395607 RepID=A0A261RVQ2_9BORD|nr:hypothetical protein [Bordetella genomosp. 1]OZI28670.1 hypothetical protein CEG14_22220 [Bordetella genomosp. 1]